MIDARKCIVLFTIGGLGYSFIEILWRGYTHPTMVLAGGVCFIIFAFIAERFRDTPLILKAALGALSVTTVEFLFGVIFNIALGMGIWDYSNVPFNILGQICPTFTLLWCVLALFFIPIASYISRLLSRRII